MGNKGICLVDKDGFIIAVTEEETEWHNPGLKL